MTEKLLVDTNVLIDYFRGNPKAVEFFTSNITKIQLSAISHAEIWAGVRKPEESAVRELLEALPVVPISASIVRRAGEIKRDQSRQTGMGLADAIIASSAESIDARLVSLNEKHFREVEDLLVPYKK